MARGGFRPGAGRPRKDRGETAERIEKAAKVLKMTDASEDHWQGEPKRDASPLEFLLSVMNDPGETKADRFRAAVAAAPYVHAKKEASAPGKKEQRDKDAEAAAAGRFAPRSRPKLAVSND